MIANGGSDHLQVTKYAGEARHCIVTRCAGWCCFPYVMRLDVGSGFGRRWGHVVPTKLCQQIVVFVAMSSCWCSSSREASEWVAVFKSLHKGRFVEQDTAFLLSTMLHVTVYMIANGGSDHLQVTKYAGEARHCIVTRCAGWCCFPYVMRLDVGSGFGRRWGHVVPTKLCQQIVVFVAMSSCWCSSSREASEWVAVFKSLHKGRFVEQDTAFLLSTMLHVTVYVIANGGSDHLQVTKYAGEARHCIVTRCAGWCCFPYVMRLDVGSGFGRRWGHVVPTKLCQQIVVFVAMSSCWCSSSREASEWVAVFKSLHKGRFVEQDTAFLLSTMLHVTVYMIANGGSDHLQVTRYVLS